MDAIFTIPYGEYAVADKLTKLIKNEKVSIFIPSSRQQKGIDMLIYSFKNNKNKTATVQVKQSRTYYDNRVICVDGVNTPVIGYLWFNRFDVPKNADWIILTGTRIIHPKAWERSGINDVSWDPIMLAFSGDQMRAFMTEVKQRKDPTKDDKMFGFWYDDKGDIFQVRGCASNRKMSEYLIERRVPDILSSLN